MEIHEEMPPTQNISEPHLIGTVSAVDKGMKRIRSWDGGEGSRLVLQTCAPVRISTLILITHGKPLKGFKDGDNWKMHLRKIILKGKH